MVFDAWQAAIKLPVALVSLAAAGYVLALRPRAPPNWFLSAFLGMIGASYALDAAWSLARGQHDPVLALRLFQVQMVFNVLDPLVLFYLLTIYPTRHRLNDVRVFAALGAVAVYLLVNVVVAPAQFSFVDAPFTRDGIAHISHYPPARLVYDLEVSGVYATCFLLALTSQRDALLPSRAPDTLIIVALGVALLPRIAFSLVDLIDPFGLGVRAVLGVGHVFGDPSLGQPATIPEPAISGLVRIIVAAAILAWGAFLMRQRARVTGARWRPAVAATGIFLIPFAFNFATTFASNGPLHRTLVFINSAAFATRWLVFATCFAAAFLYAQLYDVERRLRRASLVAAVGLALGVLVAGSFAVVRSSSSPGWSALALLGAAVLAGGSFPVARRGFERAFRRADDTDYLAGRRVEVLQSAIEEARARGRDPLQDPHLVRFRRRLGLSEDVHRRLVERPPPGPRARALTIMPGELVLERYRVGRMIGAGSGGRTWSAHDEVLGRDVALKQIFGRPVEDGGARVMEVVREAALAGRLQHPNVVSILDAHPTGVDHLLVMEHVPGGTVAALLEREGPLGSRRTARLLDGVLAGLEAVHSAGILHRDVKPANILLTATGEPKLGDFGVARLDGVDQTRTPTGGVQPGTPRYMAPEQAAGLPVGPTADLFAAAVVAHECLTGRPFVDPRGAPDAVRRAILSPAPDFHGTSASASLRAVLARALSQRPEDRYQSAREFRRALAATDEMRDEL